MPGQRAHRRYPLAVRRAASALALLLAVACGTAEDREPAAARAAPAEAAKPVVLFLGDSLTAGYGLTAEEAFPALIQARIDAAGLDYRVVNAGASGDTSAGGRRRIDWLVRQPLAVLVIALGGNDMLRGLDVGLLRENLDAIIAAARATHPDVRLVVAGMRAPRNLGRTYAAAFEAVFPAVAQAHGAALIPFLLEGVANVARLNQADGIHPTAAGQRVVADTVWETLESVLRTR